MDDRELVVQVAEGDRKAFRTLYRRHMPALYPFVLRTVGGDEMEAEDVAQDTWLRAVRALPSFRWDSSFKSWLFGIALNRIRELRRRDARRTRIDAGRPGPVLHADPPGHEDRLTLSRAVDRLPSGYRSVLVLHDIHGFTHPEIAKRLEIAVGTSRSQLYHARRQLRRLLAGQRDEDDESRPA